MIFLGRIEDNEKRLDNINDIVKRLEKDLEDFKLSKKDYNLLKKYYGSKNWFNDKDDFESRKITNVKAGVLSEDAVWNTLDDIDELLKTMKEIIKLYSKK